MLQHFADHSSDDDLFVYYCFSYRAVCFYLCTIVTSLCFVMHVNHNKTLYITPCLMHSVFFTLGARTNRHAHFRYIGMYNSFFVCFLSVTASVLISVNDLGGCRNKLLIAILAG